MGETCPQICPRCAKTCPRKSRGELRCRRSLPFEEATAEGSVKIIPMQPMPISASEIRRRASRGEDLSGMVPAAVARYIARHRLYA